MSLFVKHLKVPVTVIAMVSASGMALAGNPAPPAYTPDLLPPNPQTGECYARVEVPAQYRTESETVVIADGYMTPDISVSEPRFIARQEDVMVKEPSVRYEVRQPTYRTVTEQIMVRPAYEKLSVSRPQFHTRTETVQITEPRLVWKKGNPVRLRAQGYKIHSTATDGRHAKRHNGTTQQEGMLCGNTCEIWCLVEEPAQSVSYKRKVLSKPSTVTRVPVSARYTSITKQVVADAGGVREIPIPAQYRSITVEDIDPSVVVSSGEVNVPPKYGTIGRKVLVAPSRYEWRRVVCLPGTHPNARAGNAVSSRSNYQRSHHTTNAQPRTYTSHSVTSTGTVASELSKYKRSSHDSRDYTNSSRHTFTIPPSTTRHHLPKPVKPDTQKNVDDHESYNHHMGKRAKPRYRN